MLFRVTSFISHYIFSISTEIYFPIGGFMLNGSIVQSIHHHLHSGKGGLLCVHFFHSPCFSHQQHTAGPSRMQHSSMASGCMFVYLAALIAVDLKTISSKPKREQLAYTVYI